MLNISIPVSNSDIKILPDLVNALVKFGGLEAHKITVFATPSVADQAADITDPLIQLVQPGNLVQAPLGSEPEQGWPIGPNQHFVAVMNYMQQMRAENPWVWLEPDVTPVAPWADAYETEYNTFKRPFMGHLRDTSEVITGEQGKHMVAGGAIFPGDLWKRFAWWNAAGQRYDLPFDIFLRWEFLGAGVNHPRCHNTKLVQHCPRSASFHRNGTGVEGVPEKPDKNFVLSSEALLVHGCKDGSLSKLVCGHHEKSVTHEKETTFVAKDSIYIGGNRVAHEPAKIIPSPDVQAASSAMLNWKQTVELPEVSQEDQKNEVFQAVWNTIRGWSILVPGNSFATAPAKPGHAALIVRSLVQLDAQSDTAQVAPAPQPAKPQPTRTPEQYLIELLVESPKNEMKAEDAQNYLKVDHEYFHDMVEQSKGAFKFSGPADFFVRLTPKGLKMATK